MKFEVVTEHKVQHTHLIEANSIADAKAKMYNPYNWGLPLKPPTGVEGSVQIMSSKVLP